MKDNIIELNNMPDSYFTKCTIKRNEFWEYGMVTLNKNNQLVFTSKEDNSIRNLTEDEIKECFTKDGKPLVKNKFINHRDPKAVKIRKRRESETFESYFIIVSGKGTVTLNGEILEPGSVVLFDSKTPQIYTNYEEFCADVKVTELFDPQQVKKDIKAKKRSNSIVNNAFKEEVSDDDFEFNPVSDSKSQKSNNDGWALDKNELYKDALYIITKQLYEEQASGALPFVGYYLQNIQGGEDIKLKESECIQLAQQYKIKNAKVVIKGNKKILQGINCSLNNLEQGFWDEN